MVDILMKKTFAWEDERNKPFLYDGVSSGFSFNVAALSLSLSL